MSPPQVVKTATAISLLRYRWTPVFGIIENPRSPLLDPAHVLHVSHTARQAARPKDGLWWSVTANTMPGKSVIRHWAQRRLRAAVVKALERGGWDKSGRAKASFGAAAGKDDLTGTLHVHALSKVLQATGKEVEREALALVGIVSRKVENERKQPSSRKRQIMSDQARSGK